ncbi:hypothetical protein TI05_06390 [Achromatium sp. WMS3]|nr:hypothetical protein TI05_06390 [Achromatium sp. WMS3]
MNLKNVLIVGDLIAIIIVMAIGFYVHNETSLKFLPRFMAITLPLAATWFILAPWFGLFQNKIIESFKQLWRPVLVAFFVGPTTVVIRGFILNSVITPIFAAIVIATFALGIVLWRGVYILLARKLGGHPSL